MSWRALADDEIPTSIEDCAEVLRQSSLSSNGAISTITGRDDDDAVVSMVSVYVYDASPLGKAIAVALKDGEVLWMEYVDELEHV